MSLASVKNQPVNLNDVECLLAEVRGLDEWDKETAQKTNVLAQLAAQDPYLLEYLRGRAQKCSGRVKIVLNIAIQAATNSLPSR